MITTIEKKNGSITIETFAENKMVTCIIQSDTLNLDDICDFRRWTFKDLGLRANAKKKLEERLNEIHSQTVDFIDKTEFYGCNEVYQVEIKTKTSNYVVIRDNIKGTEFVNLHNIKTDKVECFSWYTHDIYKDDLEGCTLEIRVNEKGDISYYMNFDDLYDLNKLKKLRDSKDFKEKNFSFFFYDRVLNALGETPENNIDSMSGLFK